MKELRRNIKEKEFIKVENYIRKHDGKISLEYLTKLQKTLEETKVKWYHPLKKLSYSSLKISLDLLITSTEG